MGRAFAVFDVIAGGFVVDQFPAGVGDAVERGVVGCGIQAGVEEFFPVIGGDVVEGGDDLFLIVGLEFGAFALAAVELVAEVIHGFLAAGLLADDGVDFQPEQDAFGVKIGGAAVIAPG